MDYIGSKRSLCDWIFGHLQQEMAEAGMPLSGATFLDACAGSGAVSTHAALLGFKIIANDALSFPYHSIRGRLCFPKARKDEAWRHIVTMNNLEPQSGFFDQTYSQRAGRLFFTDENAGYLDACRAYIARECVEDPEMESYLLYCLLEAMSRVANTAGTHGAFLKELQKSAKARLTVRPESTIATRHMVVFHRDILDLLADPSFRDAYEEDVLYLDPPYNERQYAPNYHLYETLVRNDVPSVKGTTGIRDWEESRSPFCSKADFTGFLSAVIQRSRARVVALSYNSDGMMPAADLEACLLEAADADNLTTHIRRYRRYKADDVSSRKHRTEMLREYLFIVRKGNASSVTSIFAEIE